jgi:hypothetical protein
MIRTWRYAILFLLPIITAWCYWPGIGGGFAFDDIPNIVDNTELHVTSTRLDDWTAAIYSSPSSNLQRPLAMFTFAVNHYFTGLDPEPMKLCNIFLHAFNTFLLWALLSSILRVMPELDERSRRWAAAWAAAAWGLHPINLTAVLLVVQRMESLAHTFVFAGLWLYCVGRRRQMEGRGGWIPILAGLCACTAIGTLAKESSVMLTLYAFAIECLVFRFRRADTRVFADRRALPALFVVVLWLPALAATLWLGSQAIAPGAYAARDFTLGERLLTEGRVVMQYLRWSVLPDLGQMGLYHDDFSISTSLLQPWTTLASFVGLAALAALGWWLRKRRPLSSLGIAWFLCAHPLTATVIPLELVFEHRNYFASAGVCLALADILLLAPHKLSWRRGGAIVAGFLLLLFAACTHLRATEWSDPLRFSHSEARKHPLSARATYEYARTLVILSKYDRHSPLFVPAMEALEVARMAPNSNILPEQAGLILAQRGGVPEPPGLWESMQRKLSAKPPSPQSVGAMTSMVKCADLRLCSFPPDRMLPLFSAALSQGDNPEVLNIYGSYVLSQMHDVPLTFRLWREAMRLRPEEPQYHDNLIRLLIAAGDFDMAQKEIDILRNTGGLGQGRAAAAALEVQLQEARRAPARAGR